MDPNNPHPYRIGKKRYINARKKFFGESSIEAEANFKKYKEFKDNMFADSMITFGTFDDMVCCATPTKKEEGSNPVEHNTERNYLIRRLSDMWYAKRCELEKKYNIYGDNSPKTYSELIEFIKKGKYTIDEKSAKKVDSLDEKDLKYYRNPFLGIIWNGPKIDIEGYNDALEEAQKQFDKTKDRIMVSHPEDGLKALEAFEAWLPK